MTHDPPPVTGDRTSGRAHATLVLWAGLAGGALLLLLLAFTQWDRPVDPPSTGQPDGEQTAVTGGASDGR